MPMIRTWINSSSAAGKGAILLFSLACLSSVLTWIVYHSIDPAWRLGPGRLVPVSSTIEWKSAPIHGPAQGLRAEAAFQLVNRGGA